ncbi:phosphoribosylanthranilate isomerase [Parendozoicomonas haliclonae]|uniref:N-(5'-phosphoribosyl)anthranilate isomerase n=1 Tax=Parendozoicomonas haliclonae TaxID=1960125 RepID=A0A1X7AKV8_9GAMM|nr:phosphoribosylanthranilate isomerase [Parendozoicomonas haliclonae]SMA47473.1 N-(5'-phosphoribosyl)anthranilate isomerase [Parendozoicomonas haliclonae]
MLLGKQANSVHGVAVKVKVCGLREVEHAEAAVDNGADAIGLMFYAPSPRHISNEEGAAISKAVKGKASRVGVFVNPEPDYLQQVLADVELDILQFHGDEDDDFCEQWGLPWIKAVRVAGSTDVEAELARWPNASAFLLDAYTPDAYGGTGEAFDWRLFPKEQNKPLILAGGLNPGNVAQAVATVSPWAVDVSSGVESARGIKDEALIKGFLNEVKNVR